MHTVYPVGGFVVETPRRSSYPMVRCAGEIDLAAVPHLDAVILTIASTEPKAVEFDLSDVTFIDPCGADPILDFRSECLSRRIDFRLIPSPQVERLLALVDAH